MRIIWNIVLVVLVVFTLTLTPQPVKAATITIDGNTADWAGINSLGEDPQDASEDVITGIYDRSTDIRDVFVTNNNTNLFFRFDNWSNTLIPFDGEPNTGANPFVLLAVDTDNNQATGLGGASVFRGYEFVLRMGYFSPPDSVVYQIGSCSSSNTTIAGCAYTSFTSNNINFAQASNTLELSIPFSSILFDIN